jgi:hypothetical protein
MTVHPYQRHDKQWVLGRNRAEVAGSGGFGDRSRTFAFEGFWSGNKWVKGMARAMKFASESEALAYLEANYNRM